MILEQALCDENEYTRLEKIRIGCKYISSQMPFMTSFNDPQTIKQRNILKPYQVICCYPFSKNNVELLVSALFDRFRDIDFFNSFYKAIDEISQFPEQKVLLSNARSMKQSTRKSILRGPGTSTAQYSKQLIESLIKVKQFASQYLFQLFQLGQELDINLEEQANIFLKFLRNTREETFITELIDTFQNIKQHIFRNSLWSISIEDQIEQYFYTIQHPPTATRIEIPQYDTDSETEKSEIDMNEVIEEWICSDEQGYIKQQIEYFRNDVYFEFIMKLIFDPLNSQPIPLWFQSLKNEKDEINDYRIWKSDSQKLDLVYNLRSKKVLKIITNDKNFVIINKQVPQLLMKIFYLIYEALGDNEKPVNLQHIAYLIDYLFLQSPKSCLYYVVDLNLLFAFSQYLYNPFFLNIQMMNLIDDEYQLGMHVQEYFWLYIQSSQFFDYLTLIMTNQPVDKSKQERSYKSEQAYHVIPLLKAQTNFDKLPIMQDSNLSEKKYLTELLGQITPGKTPNDFYGMTKNNWHLYDDIQEYISSQEFKFKDLDNLNEFVKQRNQNHSKFQHNFDDSKFKRQRTIVLTQHNSVSPQNKGLCGQKLSAVDIDKFEVKSTLNKNSKALPRLNSASKQNKWVNVNQQKTYLRQGTQQKQQLLMNTSIRLRTFGSDKSDFSSNDGFSSSRLKTIYPSYKMQQETKFEKDLQQIHKNESTASSCAQLIKGLIQTAFHYCWRKINTLGLCKQIYKLNTDLLFCSIITKNSLERLFQIYLSSLHSPNDGLLSSADECGMIINEIYSNYPRLKQSNLIVESLKTCFTNVIDFLCKTIVKLNKQQHKMGHQQLNFKQFIITDTILYGLQMFEQNKSQVQQKNPYLYLNETVLHILVIWYFDYIQLNIQQDQFINLFILIMTRAPQHIIMHLMFKLGFITSLYNFYSKYSKNGMICTSGVESFYLHLTFIIHIINESISNRNLSVVQVSLNQLQSWQSLLQILPNPNSKAVLILNSRMKCSSIFIPTRVAVNQFHSMKSMDGESMMIPQKMILEQIKQKLNVPTNLTDKKKGQKFLNCVKEKVEQQKKDHQVKAK
ncbi:unnamed protein product [Paramecium octaurelia]|uniref:Uncharacterized protein n=1 Tax=Paramecium octaurelia TaxID=43137 RepID=A0A8S1SPS8_PAROT|nr:unnamed protein product [Paramecium octaurelia]